MKSLMVIIVLTMGCTTSQLWKTVKEPVVKIGPVIRINASAKSLGTPVVELTAANPYDFPVTVICHDPDNESVGRYEEELTAHSDIIRKLPLIGPTICYIKVN